MTLFLSDIQDPENYAIFYLDVFAESLADLKPWKNSSLNWSDAMKVFKVPWTQNTTHTYIYTYTSTYTFCTVCSNSVHLLGSSLSVLLVIRGRTDPEPLLVIRNARVWHQIFKYACSLFYSSLSACPYQFTPNQVYKSGWKKKIVKLTLMNSSLGHLPETSQSLPCLIYLHKCHTNSLWLRVCKVFWIRLN